MGKKKLKGKWKKAVAIFLSCLFLLLNVAAEFSHQHTNTAPNTVTFSKSQSDLHGVKSGQSHTLVCVACLLGLTHVAPSSTTQTLKIYQESHFAILDETTFFSVTLPTSFYLRAPPAVLA